MATPTFHAVSTPQFVASGNISVTAPTLVSGDLLLIMLITIGATSITTSPSGWVLVNSILFGTTNKYYIYSKVATGSEPGTYAFTSSATQVGGYSCSYSLPGPIATSSANAAFVTNVGNVVIPTVTVPSGGLLITMGAALINSTPHPSLSVSGQTSRLNTADSGNNQQNYLGDLAISGASGSVTLADSNAHNNGIAGFNIALNPQLAVSVNDASTTSESTTTPNVSYGIEVDPSTMNPATGDYFIPGVKIV